MTEPLVGGSDANGNRTLKTRTFLAPNYAEAFSSEGLKVEPVKEEYGQSYIHNGVRMRHPSEFPTWTVQVCTI